MEEDVEGVEMRVSEGPSFTSPQEKVKQDGFEDHDFGVL